MMPIILSNHNLSGHRKQLESQLFRRNFLNFDPTEFKIPKNIFFYDISEYLIFMLLCGILEQYFFFFHFNCWVQNITLAGY